MNQGPSDFFNDIELLQILPYAVLTAVFYSKKYLRGVLENNFKSKVSKSTELHQLQN